MEQQRAKTGGAIAGRGTSILDPNGPEADLVAVKCDEIIQLLDGYGRQSQLESIPFSLELLRTKIRNSRKPHQLELFTNDILDEVRRILSSFRYLLSKQKFYALNASVSDFYGNAVLFGELVAKKFPAACQDIERAGNCLALGEPTACVLHLHRAMEIIVRRLARRLNVIVSAKDTMGYVLNQMEGPIGKMREKTDGEKRKKERWSECRINLAHAKRAWRDPSAHGKTAYDTKEAFDIFQKVKDFTQHLATLL